MYIIELYFSFICCIKKLFDFLSYKKRKEVLNIIHFSDNFVVINKKHDLLINSNDPTKASLHSQLTKTFPAFINPKLKHNFHFVHRLDYATSGVICVAFNKKAATAAALSFEKRHAKKYYLALVRGLLAQEVIDITTPIGELKSELNGNHMMCTENDKGCISARSAHTRLVMLERGVYCSYPATKVLLRPITGRRHQLRVHCSSIGHTIVGDFTYSRKKDISPHRTFLHAFRLVLPNSMEHIDVRSPDPFVTSNDPIQDWETFEIFNNIDQAFSKVDNDIISSL